MKLIKKNQKGIFIIESIVALVIFTIGILGIIKYQGETINATTDSQNRITAAFLADSIISDMWVSQSQITAIAGGQGEIYQNWLDQVSNYLPGVSGQDSDTAPIITVTNGLDGARIIQVTVRWKVPASGVVSQYSLQSTIL